MKKIQLPLQLFLLFIFVTACAPSTSVTSVAAPTVTLIPYTPSSSCNKISTAPTPGLETPALIPPVRPSDHSRGPTDAIVTVLVYGDLQNETSALFSGVMNKLQTAFPDDVRFVSRVFPLVGRNDKAVLAAQIVEAADQQGKFWEMHDLLYAQQSNWINLLSQDFLQWATIQASGLGMDVSRFQSDVMSDAVVDLVQSNFDEAQKFGPFGVPLILINGEIYLGPQDIRSMKEIVGLILLGEKQFKECPPLLITRNGQYIATLHTEKGDVVIQLFADKAPYTVNSFVFLAQNGWYDDNTFHRVIPDLYAQTGDPSGTGKGTPGYYVITEILPELTFDRPGLVAMVNSGPDASGSQFFITLDATPQFNGQYTIFGEVLTGMDVLNSLTPRDPQLGEELPPGDKLLRVTIEEK